MNKRIFFSFSYSGETVTNETAATKIIELSRKVRELTAEKESERTKCRQLQKKIHDLQLKVGLSINEFIYETLKFHFLWNLSEQVSTIC